MAGSPANILVVCTANVCRSPLGAALIGEVAGRQLGADAIAVTSAGTHARDGDPASDGTQWIARKWGLDLSGHRARGVEAELVALSDLVITMEAAHRDAILRLHPRALGHTFTWLELARLATRVGPPRPRAGMDVRDRVAAAARAIHHARPLALEPPAGADDVADPIGRGRRHYQRMAATLVTTAEQFLPLLLVGSPP